MFSLAYSPPCWGGVGAYSFTISVTSMSWNTCPLYSLVCILSRAATVLSLIHI